jgi:hypothetical protein
VTLANRREPSFDGAHKPSSTGPHEGFHIGAADQKAHATGRATGLTRVVSSVQIVGSLLAVPLGLASGYSMYRANFAVDTTCQNLRAGIIAILDKNVDAATRRMLVRRDVATFEQTCGGIDPDAHAAFKVLLAEPPAHAAAAPKLRAALPASDATRKTEPKSETAKADVKTALKPEPKVEAKAEAKAEPKLEAKPNVKLEAKAEPKSEPKAEAKPEARPAIAEKQPADAEAAQRESDMRWLASVRQALVTHAAEKTETKTDATGLANAESILTAPARPETLAVAKPVVLPAPLQPAWTVPAPVVAGAPPAEVPAPMRLSDHPVPPGSIPASTLATPTPVRADAEVNGEESGQSKIGSWIAQIPLVGRVIERGN